MKKLIVIAGVLMLLYITAGTITTPQAKETDAVQPQQSAAEDAYRIGVAGDCVAIFRNGALIYKSDTRLSELPKADQKRLEEGIPANSLSEIKAMIEDYCS